MFEYSVQGAEPESWLLFFNDRGGDFGRPLHPVPHCGHEQWRSPGGGPEGRVGCSGGHSRSRVDNRLREKRRTFDL